MRDKQINQWFMKRGRNTINDSSRFQGAMEMLNIIDNCLSPLSAESHTIQEGIKIIRTTINILNSPGQYVVQFFFV